MLRAGQAPAQQPVEGTMKLKSICGDITKISCDAIVNAANQTLLGGGGVDGAIHRAAGPHLLEECKTLKGCKTGEAKITNGYDLPAKRVIHAVGPIWNGGKRGERKLLVSCYNNSLKLAEEYGLKKIAFPAISTGVYRYPKEQAYSAAYNTVKNYKNQSALDEVLFVFFTQDDLKLFRSITGLKE